jgi:hypothetical protein
MRFIRKFVVCFFVLSALFAGAAWVGGFNFDHRSSDVGFLTALAVLITMVLSFAIAALGEV